jgi:hypothetical protein
MKSMYKIITVFIVGMFIMTSSCTETLNVHPTSVITTNSFWKTEDDAEGALNGMYMYLRSQANLNLFVWGEPRSGDMEWGMVSGTLDYDFYYNNTLNATNAGPSWVGLYTCINAANLILKYVPTISFTSESVKNDILAQAYTMRAFMYYVLVRTWGGVPIRIKPIEGYSSQTTELARSSANDVFSLIKDDLREAISLFPDNTFPKGRNQWSKPAAEALQADVYLWTGKLLNGGKTDFDTALAACNEVGQADVSLLPNYADLFEYTNKGNNEVLMAVAYVAQESGDANNYFYNMYSGPTSTTLDPSTNEIIGQTAGGVVWTLAKFVRDQFSSDDTRKNATFETIPYSSYYPPVVEKGRGTVINGVRYFTSDIVLYRYADVLLMKAEAENALGMDPTAEINMVRERAYGVNFSNHVFVSGSQEYNDSLILKERMLELSCEGKRWWDLIRFGKVFELDPSLQGKEGQDYLLLWPIPQTVLSLEPKVTQNPGW